MFSVLEPEPVTKGIKVVRVEQLSSSDWIIVMFSLFIFSSLEI